MATQTAPEGLFRYVTVGEYAELLQLTRTTVYKRLGRGEIQGAFREGPRIWRIPLEMPKELARME